MADLEKKVAKHHVRQVSNAISTTFWLLLLVVSVILIWPASLGGKITMVMVSGTSMFPTYQNGGIVFAVGHDTYTQGDVIVYHPDDLPCDSCNIVHRIVGGNGVDGYETLGDNNENQDVWQPTDSEIVGKVEFYLEIGGVALIISNKMLWVTLFFSMFAFLAAVYAYENAKKIWFDDEEEHEYDPDVALAAAIEAYEKRHHEYGTADEYNFLGTVDADDSISDNRNKI